MIVHLNLHDLLYLGAGPQRRLWLGQAAGKPKEAFDRMRLTNLRRVRTTPRRTLEGADMSMIDYGRRT